MAKDLDYNLLFVLAPPSALTKKFQVKIHPLGPLSMTSGQPMEFRKTDVVPTGKMLYGMFENLIKFHFSVKQREEIVKQLQKFYGNQFNLLFQSTNNDKKFFPIIQHILTMELANDKSSLINGATFFSDYANTLNARLTKNPSLELQTHFGGSRTMDESIIGNHKFIKENFAKFTPEEYLDIQDKLPAFYVKPMVRQYVVLNQDIILNCVSTPELYNLMKEHNNVNKSLYLGHSESLIELDIL